jgi:hypothetical protein
MEDVLTITVIGGWALNVIGERKTRTNDGTTADGTIVGQSIHWNVKLWTERGEAHQYRQRLLGDQSSR